MSNDAMESCFPAFKAAAIEMIVAQGRVVGWVSPTRVILEALDA
jgi:hypothetical protein